MKTSMSFPAVYLTQSGRRLFLTYMTASELLDIAVIEHYDPDKEFDDPSQGYQRAEEPPRVRKMGKFLQEKQKGLLVPTAILLSSRDVPLRYDPDSKALTIPAGRRLALIDGQHRKEGFHYAITRGKLEELGQFPLPVTVIEGLTKTEEMEQFYVVNSTQKSVRTDLAAMIITQVQAQRGDVPERDLWKVVATRVIERLNNESNGPWNNLITMPNESRPKKVEIKNDPSLAHKKVLRATSMLTSLKPIYSYLKEFNLMGSDEDSQVDQIATIVGAFWEAIRRLNKRPFDTPGNYVLQKTPGLFSLHRILVKLLPGMHEYRLDWNNPKEFERLLSDIPDLQNPDYWLAKGGGASAYGSQKGFKELADLLWSTRGMS